MLPFDLRMLMLKARLGWSNASFNDLLCLLGSLLPKGNKVPTNTYRAKKNLIKPVMLGGFKRSMLALTIVSCIRASLWAWRAVRTVAWVDTRGMGGAVWMWTMRKPRVGQRRRWPRRVVWSRSHLIRKRKKVTRREEFLPYWCGTCSWSIAIR